LCIVVPESIVDRWRETPIWIDFTVVTAPLFSMASAIT
jgi:hypothetical protein